MDLSRGIVGLWPNGGSQQSKGYEMDKKARKFIKRVIKSSPRSYKYGENSKDWLAEKEAVAKRIAELAENGKVAIIESGRDCDGVEYWGNVSIIPASVVAYNHWYDETDKWADGPFYGQLARVSDTEEVEYSSRDRGMEAFEDGHPHVIYSSM